MSVEPLEPSKPKPSRLSSLFGNIELLIVVLLGLVSVTTAYASFQASIYDSQMSASYTRGQNAATAAESLYLEANQQYIQDVQTWSRLVELSSDMEGANPDLAAAATARFDAIFFVSVSADLDAAIVWSQVQNDANPDVYTSPFDSEAYNDALFSGWRQAQGEADGFVALGDQHNSLGDRLTLNTVLMAISLFLLGVSAVVRQRRTQVALIVLAVVIFIFAAALTAGIPFVAI